MDQVHAMIARNLQKKVIANPNHAVNIRTDRGTFNPPTKDSNQKSFVYKR